MTLLLPAPTLRNDIYCMDVMDFLRTLPDESVNLIVTSPPYFGLRDYNIDGQIGLEASMREYIGRMTAIFHECRRVLRKDGSLYVNIGDSYNSYKANSGGSKFAGERNQTNRASGYGLEDKSLPQKCLMMIPARLAIAMVDDGWILREEIVWAKKNPMPESVTDRCTKSHEMIYHFTKSAKYYADMDAIREAAAYDGRKDTRMKGSRKYAESAIMPDATIQSMAARGHERWQYDDRGNHVRNKRDVWMVATEPTPFAHFATYPQALIEPIILASCPATVCAKCGAPHVRVVEREKPPESVFTNRNAPADGLVYSGSRVNGKMLGHGQNLQNWLNEHPPRTVGWKPSCTCNTDVKAGIVLDPFMGSGTTALVARRHGRAYLGCDLNPEYVAIANERLAQPDKPKKVRKPTHKAKDDKPIRVQIGELVFQQTSFMQS